MKKNILVILIFLCIGVVIGHIIKDIPYLKLKPEVGIGEVGNFIIALIIAFVIPILLHRWLDNERYLKNFIIEEIQKCISSIEPIKSKINQCYRNGKTSPEDKKDINFLFKESDIRFHCLKEQLTLSFSKKSKNLNSRILEECIKYWKSVTDGELMNDTFKIDDRFYKEHNLAYANFESFLIKSIHIVNNF